MLSDKHRWNEIYIKENFPEKPSQIVKDFYHLAQKGKALDLACGAGRNAIFLQKKGFDVDAVDISDVAISKLKKKNSKINSFTADLDTFEIPQNQYDLILNINFLNRNLIPKIKDGLKKEGVVIFETFVLNKEAKTKDFYLRENELLRLFIDFYIIYYEEKDVKRDDGRMGRKAYLAAIKKC